MNAGLRRTRQMLERGNLARLAPTFRSLLRRGRGALPSYNLVSIRLVSTLAVLLAILVVGYSKGAANWDQKKQHAEFYQTEFSSAVSLACGHGFKSVASESQDVIADFLAGRSHTLSCGEAFSAQNAPQMAKPNVLQEQTITLQYIFGALWRGFGFDWDLARHVSGALLAAYALSIFLFSRTILGTFPSLALAGYFAYAQGPLHTHTEDIRDFSKAPFLTLLSALFVYILMCPPRRILPLAVISALVTAIGTGFRTDISVFLYLIPVTLVIRSCSRLNWRAGLLGLLAYLSVVVAYDVLVLNFSAGIGRNTAHFAILGQGSTFTAALRLGSDQQAGFHHYNDIAAFETVRIFARNTNLPDPGYATAQYDDASRAMLLDFTKLAPANVLIETITAAYKSMFALADIGQAGRLWLFLLTAVVVAGHFGWRGVAVFGVAAGLCAMTAVQFNIRHYFHCQTFGIIFLVVLAVVVFLDIAALLERGFGRQSVMLLAAKEFLAPCHKRFETSFAIAVVLIAGLALIVLQLARLYQVDKMAAAIDTVASFPRIALAAAPSTDAAIQNFRGDAIEQSSYLGVALNSPETCQRFPQVSVQYTTADKYMDWSYTLSAPAGKITALFFPVQKSPTNSVEKLVVKNTVDGCSVSAFVTTPNARFVPFTYFGGSPSRPAYLVSPAIDSVLMRPREAFRLLAGERRCVVANAISTGRTGVTSFDQQITVPEFIRFEVDPGKDGISSDHLDIGNPVLEVDGKVLQLSNFEIAWDDHGSYPPERDLNYAGKPMTIAGHVYESGFGTHSPTILILRTPQSIRGRSGSLRLDYGIDTDTKGAGSVNFSVCLIQ